MKIKLNLPTRSQGTKKQINFNSKHKREQTALNAKSATTLSVFPLRKSVLCLLSDASVRPLNGFTAAVPLSLSDFLPVKLVSASWCVPVRHEHKGSNIEQIKSKKYKQPITQLN